MATKRGTNGNDRITGTNSVDLLQGLAGNDKLIGLGGNDVLEGGLGNDFLDGGSGNDLMCGGAGNDTYVVGSNGDRINEQGATSKNDLVRSTVSVNLGSLGGGALEHATLLGAAAIDATGNDKSNKLTGNSGSNVLSGLGGIDTLQGGDGNDTLIGGAGNDTLSGGPGNDTYRHSGTKVDGNDSVVAGGGDRVTFTTGDVYDISFARNGTALQVGARSENEELGSFQGYVQVNGHYAGGEVATVQMDTSTNTQYGTSAMIATFHFTADLANGLNNTSDAEILLGSSGGDTINGNGGYYDALYGYAGDDVLNGGDGFDVIYGGDGADTLSGGADGDVLSGGAGVDSFDGGDGIDTLLLTSTGQLFGAIVDLSLGAGQMIEDGFGNAETVTGIENVLGSSLGDTISGDSLANELTGGKGDDVLSGGDGSDLLLGGTGGDKLIGGLGTDILIGGEDDDIFYLDSNLGADIVTDYDNPSGDLVDVSALIADPVIATDLNDKIGFVDGAEGLEIWLDADGAGGNSAALAGTLTGIADRTVVVFEFDSGQYYFNGTEFEALP